MEVHNKEQSLQKDSVDHRKQTNEQMLESLAKEGKLNDKTKEELLKQYELDVMRVERSRQDGE